LQKFLNAPRSYLCCVYYTHSGFLNDHPDGERTGQQQQKQHHKQRHAELQSNIEAHTPADIPVSLFSRPFNVGFILVSFFFAIQQKTAEKIAILSNVAAEGKGGAP